VNEINKGMNPMGQILDQVKVVMNRCDLHMEEVPETVEPEVDILEIIDEEGDWMMETGTVHAGHLKEFYSCAFFLASNSLSRIQLHVCEIQLDP
jgi:hypothetical protein